MNDRQQSSTAHPMTFLLVQSADHVTGATGKTPTVTISKDGGAFASPSGAVTEIGNGWYALAGNATDRNTVGDFKINATATGCDPSDTNYNIVPWDPYDAVRLGLTALPNAAAGANGGLPLGDASGRVDLGKILGTASAGVAGYVGIDWSHINAPSSTQALANTTISTGQTISGITGVTFPTNFGSLAITVGGAVTAGTVSDKTGYSLANSSITSSTFAANALSSSAFAQAAADKVWNTAARVLTAGTNIVLAKGTGVTGFNDIAATDVWDAARTGHQLSGSFGEYIDAAISSRSTYAGGAVASVTAPVTVGTNNDKTGYALTAAYDAAKTAAQAGNAMALTSGERSTLAAVILTDTADTLGADIVAVKAVTDKLGTALQSDGGSGFQFTVTALALAPSGGGGGLTGATPLTFRDQRGNTAPTVMDALGVIFEGTVGPTSTNPDGTINLLDPTDGTTVNFVFAAPAPVVLAASQPNYPPAKPGDAMVLGATGLDAVLIEDGFNARQMLAEIGAACAGITAGAGTANITFYAVGTTGTGTPRIAATVVPGTGERTATTLTPPA